MEKIETVVIRHSDDENTVGILTCNRTGDIADAVESHALLPFEVVEIDGLAIDALRFQPVQRGRRIDRGPGGAQHGAHHPAGARRGAGGFQQIVQLAQGQPSRHAMMFSA